MSTEMKNVPLAWYDLEEETEETGFNWFKPYTVEIQDTDNEWCEIADKPEEPLHGITLVQNGKRYWPEIYQMTLATILKTSKHKTFPDYLAHYEKRREERIKQEFERGGHTCYEPHKRH